MPDDRWKPMTAEQWRALVDACGLLMEVMGREIGTEHPTYRRLGQSLKAAFEHVEWVCDLAAKEAASRCPDAIK